MRYELKDYQVQAAQEVVWGLRRGAEDYAALGRHTAQSLSAPTGAGKTVVAADVVERLFFGDEQAAADPTGVVLWLTDDPSLNEQTKRKMLESSSKLGPSHLVTITESFQVPVFQPQRVYFLNRQKLSETALLTRRTDVRQYTIWDTIKRSIEVWDGHLVLVIDEAHRGMGTPTSTNERATIFSRFITGWDGGDGRRIPASPVVLGISATPERFNAYVNAGVEPPRVFYPATVPVDAVRSSGLLKDQILIRHPDETQPGDMTITRLAVQDHVDFCGAWQAYSEREGEPPISPILVVQVQPKRGGSLDDNGSATDMALVIQTMQAIDDSLTQKALAHSFGSQRTLAIGGEEIRYIKPEDIQADSDVKVVFFKSALSTGWDCPRAEVMLSFQTATEYTYIAQLIGRMVRAPLARRVGGSELLNSVSLYLPAYNRAAVESVLGSLMSDEGRPPVDYVADPAVCTRNTLVDPSCFTLLGGLPTYVVPSHVKRSQVVRLRKMAMNLIRDRLNEDAKNQAEKLLLDTLTTQRELMESSGDMTERMAAAAELVVRTQAADIVTGARIAEQTRTVSLDEANIQDLLLAAGRTLRDGLAQTYWAYRVAEDQIDRSSAKVETFVLATETTVVGAVEAAAEAQVQAWLTTYAASFVDLGGEARARYDEILGRARVPEKSPGLTVMDEIVVQDLEAKYESHLYCTQHDNLFPAVLNGLEKPMLSVEMAHDSFRAWYRNTGSKRAIAVPWHDGQRWRSMYPDFVFFHEIDGELRPSIVDPHGHHQADTSAKWRGLAKYAEDHGHSYHRIDAVINSRQRGRVERLDLKNREARNALSTAAGESDIERIFDQFGLVYA